MDWKTGKQQIVAFGKKYRYMILALFCGVFFMLLPDTEETEPVIIQPTEIIQEDFETELEEILRNISGVGNAEVLLTEAQGSYTLYQTNTDTSQSDSRQDTVLITNGNREESGLIKQVNPPIFQGAIVVCQGAENAQVRLAVVNAVRCVTGLSSDRISVLKMK